MKNAVIVLFMFAAMLQTAQAQTGGKIDFPLSKYNVIWNSPGKDATGSMPVGNGDLGANVYTVQNGDLYLLLGKTDAFDRMGNVLKTGRVRISLTPSPFGKWMVFTQTLNLAEGCIDIETLSRINAQKIHIRIWTDANSPVYRVEINSNRNLDIRVEPEFWKRGDHSFDKLETVGNRLVWHYTNGNRSVFQEDLDYYEIPQMAETHADPYMYNTFGCAMQVEGVAPENGGFRSYGKSFKIEISSLTQQTKDVAEWRNNVVRLLENYRRDGAWEAHCRWWTEFWNRGWITASDNTRPADEREKSVAPTVPGQRGETDKAFVVAQSYNVSRYLMACQGRGKYQTQFNGGIFTMPMPNYDISDGPPYGEDDRQWDNRFTFQNQRLMYWCLPVSGDFDLMRPFFNYFFSILDLRKAVTKAWFGHEGAYYRENMQLTGSEIDDIVNMPMLVCGKPAKPEKGKPLPQGWYQNYYFQAGLELTAMALEYYLHTENAAFLRDTLAPLAREVLTFYSLHFETDKNGKLYLSPSQVLETWWEATNPTPDIAGMSYLVTELLKLKALPSQDRSMYEQLKRKLPDISLGEEQGKKYIRLAATHSKAPFNYENPELYAAFPYPVFGVVAGNADIVVETMKRRVHKNSYEYRCWTQDQIHYACAGMGREAADGLVHRWSTYSSYLRFPFYGKESPDHVPDFDHNGSGSIALQKMLVQESEDKIFLLPAWIPEWDATFKLHLRHHTIIKGTIKDGKLESWSITPESRKKDVVVNYKF